MLERKNHSYERQTLVLHGTDEICPFSQHKIQSYRKFQPEIVHKHLINNII